MINHSTDQRMLQIAAEKRVPDLNIIVSDKVCKV